MSVQNIGNSGGTSLSSHAPVGLSKPAATEVEAAAQTSAAPTARPSLEQVGQAVEKVQQSITQVASSDLQFEIDNETGQTLVRITDKTTGELIRQIPSEEMVELAKSMDRMQGTLLRQQQA